YNFGGSTDLTYGFGPSPLPATPPQSPLPNGAGGASANGMYTISVSSKNVPTSVFSFTNNTGHPLVWNWLEFDVARVLGITTGGIYVSKNNGVTYSNTGFSYTSSKPFGGTVLGTNFDDKNYTPPATPSSGNYLMPGSKLMVDFRIITGSGNLSNGLALDNLAFKFTAVPEPGNVISVCALLGVMLSFRQGRSRGALA
ncbi:MAG: hypothetical protein WCN98_14320, partial [Verrucomicrobiaceae bacterium]